MKRIVNIGYLNIVIGFIFIFFSVRFGNSIAENWLYKQGSVDTSIYLIAIQGYINSFLTAGRILLGIGLFTIVFGYYKILKLSEIE
ncbi:hypothetical protein [Bacillus sp. B1-b2]|uniref:hypothetical protein n=1 Tax=Bacillus sp. B1-b2 TaxID=2653201 RepID=UPI001262586B|nr:hypothetical protein [Bacillus sp. B1-b2]KAB7672225.1 hypothetical protein F9279_04745 [Bacillus sp. B1-b2]